MRKLLFSLLISSSLLASNSTSIHANYLYWLAGEDGLGIGRSGNFIPNDDPLLTSSMTYLTQPFEFQSGFQVGVDWEDSNWILSSNYTWIRNKTTSNSAAPLLPVDVGTGVWLIAPWFIQTGQDGGSLSGTQIDSTWKLGMDIADLTLKYRHPVGSYLVFFPFGGLRAAWIRQSMAIALTEPPDLFPSPTPQPIHSLTSCHSWSLGPRFGADVHLIAGGGFRIQGNLAISLLYTDYTQITHSEEAPATDSVPGPFQISSPPQSTLRPVLETGVGLGWSSANVDLAASYDFLLWWAQNMMREFMSSSWNEAPTNGNLSLQGLSVSLAYKF